MNAKKAVELIRDYENHITDIEYAADKLEELGENYRANDLRKVVTTLREQIDEINERLESAEI